MSNPTPSSRQSFWQKFFLTVWYQKPWWSWFVLLPLLPLSWLYQCLAGFIARQQKKRAVTLALPVVVIGNISVGGTGKTPVIIALANALREQGVAVGIVSRGYGSHAPHYPYLIDQDDNDAHITGDEPLLIAQSTQCPVVIARDRVAAAQYLIDQPISVDVILSDDGLQHYRLARNVEVVVVDGERGLGNHCCLPAGPLRESASRLSSVDWILRNHSGGIQTDTQSNTSMSDKSSSQTEPQSNIKPTHAQVQSKTHSQIQPPQFFPVSLSPTAWTHVASQQRFPLQPFPWDAKKNQRIIAVAGIGNPQRFFDTCKVLDITSDNYAFDDHHVFSKTDIDSWDNAVVLMTEKDAVKCRTLASNDCWSLVVDITLPNELVASVVALIKS